MGFQFRDIKCEISWTPMVLLRMLQTPWITCFSPCNSDDHKTFCCSGHPLHGLGSGGNDLFFSRIMQHNTSITRWTGVCFARFTQILCIDPQVRYGVSRKTGHKRVGSATGSRAPQCGQMRQADLASKTMLHHANSHQLVADTLRSVILSCHTARNTYR